MKIEKTILASPTRRLDNKYTVEYIKEIPESMLDTPFENFFAYWVYNRQDLPNWGPEYWRQFGVDVKDSQLVFDSEQHRLLFLLRWS
jgi:hypothetical protein